MDLNYLLSRHQISLMRADSADSIAASRSHRGLAIEYAKRIRLVRQGLGAGAAL